MKNDKIQLLSLLYYFNFVSIKLSSFLYFYDGGRARVLLMTPFLPAIFECICKYLKYTQNISQMSL